LSIKSQEDEAILDPALVAKIFVEHGDDYLHHDLYVTYWWNEKTFHDVPLVVVPVRDIVARLLPRLSGDKTGDEQLKRKDDNQMKMLTWALIPRMVIDPLAPRRLRDEIGDLVVDVYAHRWVFQRIEAGLLMHGMAILSRQQYDALSTLAGECTVLRWKVHSEEGYPLHCLDPVTSMRERAQIAAEWLQSHPHQGTSHPHYGTPRDTPRALQVSEWYYEIDRMTTSSRFAGHLQTAWYHPDLRA